MSVTETPVIASALLTNEVGLHARPAVKLTQLAKSFGATVELALEPDGPWVDAKSPVRIMRVKAPKGALLYFRAWGGDADAAIGAMVDLVERRFDEEAPEEVGQEADEEADRA
jgi:phosphocarrier protein HPr